MGGVVVSSGATARYESNTHAAGIWHDMTADPANATDSPPIVATITGISNALVGVVTAAGHGFADFSTVKIEGVIGMPGANGIFMAKNTAANTFELYTIANVAVDTTNPPFGAYGGGGIASLGDFTWPDFNGTSWSEIGTPAKLNFADAFTLCAWAKSDMVTHPLQANEAVIYKSNRTTKSDVIFNLTDSNGQITFGLYTAAGLQTVQSGAGWGGAWHLYTMVNEGLGNDAFVFVDGALVGTGAGKGGAVGWDVVPWLFGKTAATGALGATDFFQGLIDTGRFYDRALSADEILRDYNAGKPAHA